MPQPFVQTYKIPSGTRYRAWWYDAANRKASKVFHTKREAQAYLRDRVAEEATGTLTDTVAGRVRLESVWNERHDREPFAEATLKLHAILWERIGPVLGKRPVAEIKPAHVEAALAKFDGRSIRDKARSTLVATFNYAIAEGRIATNPAKARRKSQTRVARMAASPKLSAEEARRLTPAELRALIDAVPERNRMLVELMARMGLRPGEAYALTVEQFDGAARKLKIDRTISAERFTKTGQPRELTLPTIIAEHLAGHIERYSTNGLVFPNEDGNEYTLSGFRTIFQRAAAKLGVNHGFSPKDLRHTAAAFAIAHGANVYDVQQMLGHAKPSITLDVYGFMWSGSADRLAAALETAIREEQ
jgi:integrase